MYSSDGNNEGVYERNFDNILLDENIYLSFTVTNLDGLFLVYFE